jgi:hypothetical protein
MILYVICLVQLMAQKRRAIVVKCCGWRSCYKDLDGSAKRNADKITTVY